MRRHFVPGAWFGDVLASGEYAALVPGASVYTHAGEIPIPEQERAAGGNGPWMHRIAAAGGFKVAGQSHAGLGTWALEGGAWRLDPRIAHGVNPVIFDHAGVQHFATPAHGSQGFRFVDESGRIWTGDETIADHARAIGEWTQLGDVTIGQGGWNAVILADGKRRVLTNDLGVPLHSTTFIRYDRQGDNLAACCTVPGGVWFFWFHRSEIALFPEQAVVLDPPPPPPPPPPKEPPVTWERRATNIVPLIEKLIPLYREAWIAMNDARNSTQFLEILLSILHYGDAELGVTGDPRWGWNGKRGTDEKSADVVAFLNPTVPKLGVESFDIVEAHGAGPAAQPAWIELTNPDGAGAKWIAPGRIDRGGGVVPPPKVKDPRLAPTHAGLLAAAAQLAAIEPVVCALPHNPVCDKPHGDGRPKFPVESEPELQARVEEWRREFAGGTRRIMPPSLTAFLLYRFFVEGYTHEQLLEDAARRGQE